MGPQLAPVSLAAIQRPMSRDLDAVLAELRRIIAAELPQVAEVNRHVLRMRGKLFRPTLLLLSAEACGARSSRDVTLAAVLELIHLATLIHDDSVDHSVLRRGQPTVNARFSHQVAVIMGDFLYSRAIIELVALDDPEPLRVMARVTNEMTLGEMRELAAHDALDYSEEEYDELIRSKTASLMSAACEIGALRGTESQRDHLRAYGLALGMAFQITDDLLDYTGTESETGKPTGLDLREHKITLPLIAALPRLSAEDRRAVEHLMADPTPSDALIAQLIGAVEASGGLAAARERAVQFAERADAALEHLPPRPAREALRDCITYAIERRS